MRESLKVRLSSRTTFPNLQPSIRTQRPYLKTASD